MLQFALSEDKKYYIVTGCDKDAVSVEIPAEYNGLPVKEIGERAFQEHAAMTEIIIPNTITHIGFCAFMYCHGLKSITIPDGVVSIADNALCCCFYLKEISIPDSVTSIGNGAFASNVDLISIRIPKDIKCINYGVFRGCESLKSVIIPDGVTSIGEDAFAECFELTDITIPNTVTEIGGWAFRDCRLLENIVIPNSVTKIQGWVFEKCDKLSSITLPFVGESVTGEGYTHLGHIFGGYDKNHITVPKTLKSVTITGGRMEMDSLEGCDSLTHVSIGEGVECVKNGALKNCNNLEELTLPYLGESLEKSGETHLENTFGVGLKNISSIPKTLTHLTITGGEIKKDNFKGCSSLTSVTIGNGVQNISEGSFSGCTSLEKITLPFVGVSEQYTHFGAIFGINKNNFKSKVKDNFIAYNTFIPKSLQTVEITGSNDISDYAFSHCYDLTEIIIGNDVKNIGFGAFTFCTSLTKLSLPYVASLGQAFGAFQLTVSAGYVSTSLKTVVITGDRDIDRETFAYCENLESVIISGNVTNIEGHAFWNCNALKEVTLGDSVKSIAINAFAGCSALTEITLPSTLEVVEMSAFSACNALTKVNYTGTVDEWAQISFGDIYANPLFYAGNLYLNDDLVTNIEFTTATKISNDTFVNCGDLSQVIIGDSVASIDENAFNKCNSLTSVSISPSVKSIGENAFSNLPLQKVEFVNYVGWHLEIPRKGKKPKIKKINKKLLMDEVKSAELLTEYSSAKWVNTLDLSKMKKF